jgi:hypothetical protein
VADLKRSAKMISYIKGVPLSLIVTAAAVLPSALYHGVPFAFAIGFTLFWSGIAIFVDWAKAGRWEPKIRPRWFYLNLTSPAVSLLAIQAIGWRVLRGNDASPQVLFGLMTFAHLIACMSAIAAFVGWMLFSFYLKKNEPNQELQPTAPSGRG